MMVRWLYGLLLGVIIVGTIGMILDARGYSCTNCVPRIEPPPPITYYCRRIVPTLVGYRCLRSSARPITIVGVP